MNGLGIGCSPQERVVKPVFVATLAIAGLMGFARLAHADPANSVPNQTGHTTGSAAGAPADAASPDLLSWDECRTRLDTYNGRDLIKQQRVMDYCLGMERGREAMREELQKFPGRASVSTQSISIAPLFLPNEMGLLPAAVIGR